MKEKLIKKFDRQAASYNNNRKNRRLEYYRKILLAGAQGNVLEVAVGVGDNFHYYPKEQVKVTAIDFSGEMLKYAESAAKEANVEASFIQANLENINFPKHSFDCIVSTMTLCSYTKPVHILNQMNHWCKPNGQILMLEHGLSSNRFFRFLQHGIDPFSNHFSGCHMNRDIKSLVLESDLYSLKMERYLLDMIYLIWAKPQTREL